MMKRLKPTKSDIEETQDFAEWIIGEFDKNGKVDIEFTGTATHGAAVIFIIGRYLLEKTGQDADEICAQWDGGPEPYSDKDLAAYMEAR